MEKVMVCLPTKNDDKHLPRFLIQLNLLTYPKDRIRIVIIYGGEMPISTINFLKRNKFHFEVYPEPQFENKTGNSLWIADVLNHFKNFYRKEDFVLMMDTDISFIQPDLIQELIKEDKDVIAPFIWQEFAPYKEFFDTYVFRYNGNQCFSCYNPPFEDKHILVEMESVGTMFLIRSKVFIEANWENPVPHLQFCKNVRRLGYKIWACPYITVFHADVRNEPHPSIKGYEEIIGKEMMIKDDSRI